MNDKKQTTLSQGENGGNVKVQKNKLLLIGKKTIFNHNVFIKHGDRRNHHLPECNLGRKNYQKF